MVVCETVCLRRLGGNRGGELPAGRFFASPKVTAAKLVEGWADRTGEACAGRHVLAIQDRSEVTFPTAAQRRRGLGPVKKGNAYGVLVHAMVAVDAETGSCLGLVGGAGQGSAGDSPWNASGGGDVWTRSGVSTTHHRRRPLAERESIRWVDTAQRAKQVLEPAAMVTVVDDREADIYPKWALVPETGFHLLTRAMSDRLLAGGGTLFRAAVQFPVSAKRTIDLPARQPAHAGRTAVVELRSGQVEICRPRDERDHNLPQTVRLRLVEVRETKASRRRGTAALAVADHAQHR